MLAVKQISEGDENPYQNNVNKEDLFSLSSTQPENRLEVKLQSPLNTFMPKQIDFTKQINSTTNNNQNYDLQQRLYPITSTSQYTKQQREEFTSDDYMYQDPSKEDQTPIFNKQEQILINLREGIQNKKFS